MPDWQKQYINPKPQTEQSLRGLQTQKQQSGEQTQQSDPWLEQRRRQAENNLLMNGMDTLYGMNRAVNGMTFGGLDWLGNKIGFDSQMKEYLNLKDPENRNLAQTAGNIAQLGGAMLTGGTLAKTGYDQANMVYNGYKIGKKYDELIKDPYQGSGKDVIARMKNHNGEPVVLQRGEAIKGENSNVIVHGKLLKRETGSERNYGLDKIIYKHDVNRSDTQRIPRIIQEEPFETNGCGQNVYMSKGTSGDLRVVTSPIGDKSTVVSMYYPKK